MTSDTEPERQSSRSLTAEISTAIVKMLREYTGRGPTKAHTTVRDNVVLVMLEAALTKGEKVLVQKGRGDNVLALRMSSRRRCARRAAPRSPSSRGET